MESFVTLFLAVNGAASCWWLADKSALDAPVWASSQGGQLYLNVAPLACLLIGLLALASGFVHLAWWLPIVQLVVALIAMIATDAIFGVTGVIVGSMLFPALSVVGAVWLVMTW